ncbi:MAG: prepilin peptidase, partial [Chloroflexota bacterium]
MAVAWGVLGLVFGGILNVLISRLPYGGGLVAAPLHCHYCHHPLGLADTLPLWGYAGQRGRCRHCGHALSLRFPLVEVATSL